MKSAKWKLAALEFEQARPLIETPGEMALYWYMRSRRRGATRAEMLEALKISERTLDRALVGLRGRGVLEGA